MTVELIKVEWREYIITNIILEDEKNEIHAYERGNKNNKKIFIMPIDKLELCK